MRVLSSAFSLQMLPKGGTISVERLDEQKFIWSLIRSETQKGFAPEGFRQTYRCQDWDKAVVGHPGTAEKLRKLFGVPVPVCRETISLQPGDVLYVAQPVGTRLSPGQEVGEPELAYFRVTWEVATTPAPPEVPEGERTCPKCGQAPTIGGGKVSCSCGWATWL